MARRRKDDQIIGLVAQLGALAVLGAMVSPQVRRALSTFGIVAVCGLGGAVLIFVTLRLFGMSSSRKPVTSTLHCDSVFGSGTVAAVKREDRIPNTAKLIEKLRTMDWFQFEKLIAVMYRRLGYEVVRRGGANPDGGIDLVVQRGVQTSAIQCKQWKTQKVGVNIVREFVGALTCAGIYKGIFITLRGYTDEAKRLAEERGIEIIDQASLAEMLEDANARFDPEVLEILNDPRKFCPKCEREMVLRTAKKGARAGDQFWGCPAYPRCSGKLEMQKQWVTV